MANQKRVTEKKVKAVVVKEAKVKTDAREKTERMVKTENNKVRAKVLMKI